MAMMALEHAFYYHSCPPLLGTFSFAHSPILTELPTHSCFPPDEQREATYREWCQTVGNSNGLGNLEWVYGRAIRGTLLEICSSIVVRSEHQFTADEHRLSLRKHVYEFVPRHAEYHPPGDPDDPRRRQARALSYDRLTDSDRFGQYLGFIDLRLSGLEPTGSPVALAVLAVPKALASDPTFTTITGGYGAVFGGPSYPATVYSMSDQTTGGAVCAQACIIMAVGLLSDRGARVLGSHSITFLGRPPEPANPPPAGGADPRPEDCVARHRWYSPQFAYEVDGLKPRRIYDLLRRLDHRGRPLFRVSPGLIASGDRKYYTDSLVVRLFEAYLDARLPIILAVDWATWMIQPTDQVGEHAVVLVGLRRRGGKVTSFLAHDPSDRPFTVKGTERVLTAAWAYGTARGNPPALRAIPVADEKVRVHLHECLDWLRGPDGRRFLADHEPAAEARRLRRQFDDYLAGAQDHDLRLLLLDPSNPEQLAGRQNDRSIPSAVSVCRAVGNLPNRRHWCVAGTALGQLRHVWLFDTVRPPADGAAPPTLRLFLEVRGTEAVVLYRAPAADGWDTVPVSTTPPTPPKQSRPRAHPRPRVNVSVLSSCSTRPLREFVTDVATATGNTTFDLLTVREIDVREIGLRYRRPYRAPEPVGGRPRNPLTAFLAQDGVDEILADWYERQFRRADQQLGLAGDRACRVAALASYLPWLSAIDNRMRNRAVRALANATLVACHLKLAGRMDEAIIETTCGTLHDPCWCSACRRDDDPARRSFVSGLAVKRRILLDSLGRVADLVRSRPVSQAIGHRFYVALEYEPGVSYLLNSEESLKQVFAGVEQDALLRRHVGLNLDIAHMRIDGITAAALRPFEHLVLHAHVADHPELMHTRDLPPGHVTPGLVADSEYLEYFRLLSRRAASAARIGERLPYSGTCAIELEGVDRTDWIYDSVPVVRHVAAAAAAWDEVVPVAPAGP